MCLTFVVSLIWICGFEYDILGVEKGRDRFESEGDENLQEREREREREMVYLAISNKKQ